METILRYSKCRFYRGIYGDYIIVSIILGAYMGICPAAELPQGWHAAESRGAEPLPQSP